MIIRIIKSNRTRTDFLKIHSNRTELEPALREKNEPNRTRTDFLKIHSNRTELEPALREKNEPNRTRSRKSRFDSLSGVCR